MTWKCIYTYRKWGKTGPAHNRCWKWSPLTSKHTWMRFSDSLGLLAKESPYICSTVKLNSYTTDRCVAFFCTYTKIADNNKWNANRNSGLIQRQQLAERLQASQNSPYRLARQEGCARQVGAVYLQFVCNEVYTSWRCQSSDLSTGKLLPHEVTFANYLQIDMLRHQRRLEC
jgi:hypothetical protein